VWNRTAARTQPLVADGARAAASPAEAAAGAEFVITMLADPAALSSVLEGPDGVLAGIRPGACLVDMSTVGPAAALAARSQLPAGVGFVDAPVMGSVGPAASGELVVLAAKDLGLATDAAGLPQLAAARDWLRAAAAEGAADEDLRTVVDHIHPT
jgi:3-hydroxyisobutyrate dehydrogenase